MQNYVFGRIERQKLGNTTFNTKICPLRTDRWYSRRIEIKKGFLSLYKAVELHFDGSKR